MEITSTFLEHGLGRVNELVLPVVGASSLYLILRPVADRPVVAPPTRRRAGRVVGRGVSLLGLLVTFAAPASAVARRGSQAETAPQVRTEPGRFPPPRLPGSAGPPWSATGLPDHRPESPPWVDVRSADGGGDTPPPVENGGRAHRVVHGGVASDYSGRLFERWRAAPPVGVDVTLRSNESRPAPAERPGARAEWHAVLPGETLWSIAQRHLGTDDVRRVARYWPRIHRANRSEIGPNPNLIRPGQVLELPPEGA